MKLVSLSSVIELLNSEDLVKLFNKEELEYLKQYSLSNSFQDGSELDALKSTKLYLKVFNS
jgi:hypothetical protein